MSSFARHDTGGVVLWVGDPDCQAAHDAIVYWLQENCPLFSTQSAADDTILRGNLGETMAFCIGHWYVFNETLAHAFTANALNPFGKGSRPGIDLVWIRFSATPDDAVAVLQEVKTTGVPSLTLADTLRSDYDKLFGTDPRFTLHTR